MYVYIEKGRVWYVGQTVNLPQRLQAHHSISRGRLRNIIHKVNSCRLVFYPCSDPFMSFLESFLIYCFEPPGNTVWPRAYLISSQEHYDLALEALYELKELCR